MLEVLVVGYVVALFGISAWSSRQIHSMEDFAVAGRRLSLPWATATLLATWFGAGTLLTAADEIKLRGLEAATLDPIGAGLCLLLAGAFFAGPLWREKLTTLPELYGRRFGPRAEWLGGLLMVPTYFGWVAAQFIALGQLLHLVFGLDLTLCIVLVALVGTGYTFVGGMWAVTLTDGLQVLLMILGLGLMTWVVGDAWLDHGHPLPAGHWRLVPRESVADFVRWTGVLFAGSLGNLPSQDLMQRVFSARSARVAVRACLWAGAAYLVLGGMPVFLGLAAAGLPTTEKSVLPMLAQLFLHPALAAVFVLTILSAVLSTIDSALLAPATVLAQNVLVRIPGVDRIPELPRNRAAVLLVAGVSLALTFSGESAYGLLESAYELTMVCLLAPLVWSVYGPAVPSGRAVLGMSVPFLAWTLHVALSADGMLGLEAVPIGIGCTLLSFALFALPIGRRPPSPNARPGGEPLSIASKPE
ncbi:MAG: sodium:solute symporter family protein [Myxococcota bacterium]